MWVVYPGVGAEIIETEKKKQIPSFLFWRISLVIWSLQFCVFGNLRQTSLLLAWACMWGRWVHWAVKAAQGTPLAVVQHPGSEVCGSEGDLGTSVGYEVFLQRQSYKEFVMGQAVWGKKTQVLPGPTGAFPQAFAVPLPGCCFLTLFNVLLHIMEGTTGTLERILEFSQACIVFVLEVKEHLQDQSGSWVSVCFQGCFCFSCQNLLRLVNPWWL